MSRSHLSFCSFLLVSVLGAPAAAQTPPQRALAQPAPSRIATLDLATGLLTRGPVAHPRAASTVSDFPNLDLSVFVGLDSGAGLAEWYEAGVKGTAGNASDLMRTFAFAYCTKALDPSAGGMGGGVALGFYEGYATGGPDPGPGVAHFTLIGLPANTALGATRCYQIQVLPASLIPFADGPIGYSWRFIDLNPVGGPAAATVPFLSCVASCLGPGPDGLGMDNLIDRYFPPDPGPGGTPAQSTFGAYFTSISMDIREVTDCMATVVAYDSFAPPNVDALTSGPAIVGQPWSAEVTHAAGTAVFSMLMVRGSKIPGNGAPAGGFGRLLVTGGFYANLAGGADAIPPILASQLNFAATIPPLFALACVEWFAQAVTAGTGEVKLSNGIDGDTGTF